MRADIKRRFKIIEVFIEIFLLIPLFLFGILIDYMFAASLYWQFHLVMAALALISLLPIYLGHRRRRGLVLFLAFNISLLILHFAPLNAIKPLTKIYLKIEHGMTIQEVQSLFNQHFPKGGITPQPKLEVWDLKGETEPTIIEYQRNGKSFAAKADKNLHYSILDGKDTLTIYFKDGKVIDHYYAD